MCEILIYHGYINRAFIGKRFLENSLKNEGRKLEKKILETSEIHRYL